MAPRDDIYKLPHDEYIAVKRVIRKYPKLKEQYDAISALRAVNMDGLPRSSQAGDPTSMAAMSMVELAQKMDVIYKPLFELPVYYRDGIFQHICYGVEFPDYASVSTWRRWQYRYVYKVKLKLEEYHEWQRSHGECAEEEG